MKNQPYRVQHTNSLFKNQYQFKLVLDICPVGLRREAKYFDKVVSILDTATDNFEIFSRRYYTYILSNSLELLEKVIDLDPSYVLCLFRVKRENMQPNTICLPSIAFEYKVHVRTTTTDHKDFIEWATNNKNIKLLKSCVIELSRPRSYGGTYFYVSGENNLLLVKMLLGTAVGRIETIVK